MIRAAAPEGPCPDAVIDGKPTPMRIRRAASDDFPTACQLPLPADAKSASVAGQALPIPAPAPQRIVLLGDSGCRIQGVTIQSCNNPQAWPFPTVAQLAAAKKPDLVIHVGDYYYRENACPIYDLACAGSPYGDNWATWQTEFFGPASPLLAAAPWVFVRGNHEVCGRGGVGWYVFLDAASDYNTCSEWTRSFTVDIGGLKLYILDSGNTVDRSAPPFIVDQVKRELDQAGPTLDRGKGWIITHRPVWGLVPIARVPPLNPAEIGINVSEQKGLQGRDLSGVQMIVSGHIHDFQSLSFGPQRPAQLIVGTGGDVGEPADIPRIRRGPRHIDGMDADFLTFDRFGYLLLERQGEDWAGAFHDAEDRVVATCRLHERDLKCEPAKR